MPKDDSSADLAALRWKITDLVARNAVRMVQNAIDAVNEGGQYQTIKYLFEMIRLYPASTAEEAPEQDSLAQILLESLGISEDIQRDSTEKVTARNPLKSE